MATLKYAVAIFIVSLVTACHPVLASSPTQYFCQNGASIIVIDEGKKSSFAVYNDKLYDVYISNPAQGFVYKAQDLEAFRLFKFPDGLYRMDVFESAFDIIDGVPPRERTICK